MDKKIKITPQLVLTRLQKALAVLFMGGVLYFYVINWLNSGDWGIFSMISMVFITVGSAIKMGIDGDEELEEAQPTWSSIGKGLLIGFVLYILLSIIAVVFGWPVWAIMLITGFSMFISSSIATDKGDD